MKNRVRVVLLALSVLRLAFPSAAAQSASAQPKTAAGKLSTPSRKTPGKKAAHKAQTGKATAGEAARQAKKETETGGDERDLRVDNRGRVSAAHHAKTHQPSSQIAKASHKDKHNAVAASHRPGATVQHTAQSHPTAALKTSQLTAGKTVTYHTKQVSMHRGPEGKGKTRSKKTPDPAQSSSPSPSILKQNNARMF